jgi:hypothetical protein
MYVRGSSPTVREGSVAIAAPKPEPGPPSTVGLLPLKTKLTRPVALRALLLPGFAKSRVLRLRRWLSLVAALQKFSDEINESRARARQQP